MAREPVSPSADITIKEVPLGSVGMRSLITLYHLDKDIPSLGCLSVNQLGSDSFVFNISSSQTQPGRKISQDAALMYLSFRLLVILIDMVYGDFSGLHTVSLLIGSTLGALVMLFCASFVFFLHR